jgi:hypothetical protein
MSQTPEYKEYKEQKEKLQKKFPGLQKWDCLRRAMLNIHKYDEEIQFLIMFDTLEHNYNLLKARQYRANAGKSKIKQQQEMINDSLKSGLDMKQKIEKFKLSVDIPSNLVTPCNSEPCTAINK